MPKNEEDLMFGFSVVQIKCEQCGKVFYKSVFGCPFCSNEERKDMKRNDMDVDQGSNSVD